MIKNSHEESFKIEAVRAVKRGKRVAEVATMCEVGLRTVYDWIEIYGDLVNGEDPSAAEIKLREWKRFDDDTKLAAVREVEKGRRVEEVAKEVGVGERTMYRWCEEFSTQLKQPGPVMSLDELQEKLAAHDETKQKALAAKQEAKRRDEEFVREAMADAITWMQKYTKTKDSHWRENGADSPYRHLPDRPDRPQFRVMLHDFTHENPYFVPKSRDMLVSWTLVGIFTHKAMTTAGIDICFQSQKQEKANELIEYAKILYEQSYEAIKKAYPLDKKVQPLDQLCFANGSRIIAIPGGGDQIRSYHPWGLLMDEAAFMPEAGDSFNIALPVCKKIVVVSSAGPGWFAETVSDRDDTQNNEEFEEKAALYRAIGMIADRA